MVVFFAEQSSLRARCVSVLLLFSVVVLMLGSPSIERAFGAPNDNSYLAELTMLEGELSPQFRMTTLFYQVDLSDEVTTLTINAVPADEQATVVVTGHEQLRPGINLISVTVTAQDGTSTVYEIEATRAGAVASDDATLRKLTVRDYSLTPSFRPDHFAYLIEVDDTIEQLDIIAIPNSEQAHVSIVGNERLSIGENTITITVTAQDGQAAQTYMLTVDKFERVDVASSSNTGVTHASVSSRAWIVSAVVILTAMGVSLIIARNRNEKSSHDNL